MRSDAVSGCITARAIVRCSELAHTAVASKVEDKNLLALQGLVVHFIKGRNAVVPFEQRSGVTDPLNRAFIQFPYRVDHRMIVRIQNVAPVFRVSRDVNLRHRSAGTLFT